MFSNTYTYGMCVCVFISAPKHSNVNHRREILSEEKYFGFVYLFAILVMLLLASLLWLALHFNDIKQSIQFQFDECFCLFLPLIVSCSIYVFMLYIFEYAL